MATIRWSVESLEDLQSITGYIGRNSPTYAAVVSGRIVAAVETQRRIHVWGVPSQNTRTRRFENSLLQPIG